MDHFGVEDSLNNAERNSLWHLVVTPFFDKLKIHSTINYKKISFGFRANCTLLNPRPFLEFTMVLVSKNSPVATDPYYSAPHNKTFLVCREKGTPIIGHTLLRIQVASILGCGKNMEMSIRLTASLKAWWL